MKRMFLEKFFPASRTERFNKLCATCSHHQISEQLLIQYFYEGLMMMDRSMIDVASGGALIDKTSVAARHLISNMANNIQQFRIRGASQSRMMNEIGIVDNLRLENQLTKLTSLVRQLAVRWHQPTMAARVCGILAGTESSRRGYIWPGLQLDLRNMRLLFLKVTRDKVTNKFSFVHMGHKVS
ncbi:hypothetical protein CR513_53394, partial [Mucuna pruriens]